MPGINLLSTLLHYYAKDTKSIGIKQPARSRMLFLSALPFCPSSKPPSLLTLSFSQRNFLTLGHWLQRVHLTVLMLATRKCVYREKKDLMKEPSVTSAELILGGWRSCWAPEGFLGRRTEVICNKLPSPPELEVGPKKNHFRKNQNHWHSKIFRREKFKRYVGTFQLFQVVSAGCDQSEELRAQAEVWEEGP